MTLPSSFPSFPSVQFSFRPLAAGFALNRPEIPTTSSSVNIRPKAVIVVHRAVEKVHCWTFAPSAVDAPFTSRHFPVARLTTVYAVFTAGHHAPVGELDARLDLADEGVRLSRLLVELMPDEAECVGLLALTLATNARRRSRTVTGVV